MLGNRGRVGGQYVPEQIRKCILARPHLDLCLTIGLPPVASSKCDLEGDRYEGAGCNELCSGRVALLSNSGAVGADKNQYWLFNPTPDRLLREMTTDRPDITESPFTVDAGHVQFETTLVGYTRSAPDQERTVTDEFEFATTNMRIGITNSAEIDLVWQPYGTVRIRQADPLRIFDQSGIGRLNLRAKVNLWGNDSFEKPGATALALLPFVMLPTDRHNGISPEFVAGGIISTTRGQALRKVGSHFEWRPRSFEGGCREQLPYRILCIGFIFIRLERKIWHLLRNCGPLQY